MSLVEYSNAGIVEATQQQIESHPNIRDVGKRDQNLAARLEQAAQLLEYRARIAQVLEHVAENHRVVTPQLVEINRLDVCHEHFATILASNLSHLRICFNTGDRAAA